MKSPVFLEDRRAKAQTSKRTARPRRVSPSGATAKIVLLAPRCDRRARVSLVHGAVLLCFFSLRLVFIFQSTYILIAHILVIGRPLFSSSDGRPIRSAAKASSWRGCLLESSLISRSSRGSRITSIRTSKRRQSRRRSAYQRNGLQLSYFVGPWSKFTDCDKAKDFLTKQGISFKSMPLPAGSTDNVARRSATSS